MQKIQLMRLFYGLGAMATFVGATYRIMHWANANLFLWGSYLLFAGFMFLAAKEVIASQRIGDNEKTMWTVGFIFLPFITGFIYLIRNKRVTVI
jgi:hypothetical protein